MNALYLSLRQKIANAAIPDITRWTILGGVVGVMVGLLSLIFNVLLDFVQNGCLGSIAGFLPPVPGGETPHAIMAHHLNLWALALLPAVGGLACGIIALLAPETSGGGLSDVIDRFHHKRGLIRNRVPWVKVVISSITIGTGGSGGREGPMGQAGAGIGSALASWLHLRDRDRRVLLLCGIAAGIGSVFKAPLGGALFAAESLYRDPEFESEALIPCFVASIIAYSIFCVFSGLGWGSLFHIPDLSFNHPLQLAFYAVLGLGTVLFGVFHVMLHQNVERLFHSSRIGRIWRPAIGGLAVGCLSLLFTAVVSLMRGPQVGQDFTGGLLGMGYGYVQWAINNRVGFGLTIMLLMAVMKIIATCLTIGSGGSAGDFAPSLVIGALLGGAFGHFFNRFFPAIVPQAGIPSFVLVGMAGYFTSVSKTPLAAIFMVAEMTFGYHLLVPLMLVVAISYNLTPRRFTLYPAQLPNRLASPAHTGDFIVDVLEGMSVRDVMHASPLLTILDSSRLGDFLQKIIESRQSAFPVVNKNDELAGVIRLNDVRSAFLNYEATADLIIARDLAITSLQPCSVDESLNTALGKLVAASSEELPVVAEDDHKQVVGLIARHDLIAAYSARMQERLREKNGKLAR